MFNGKEKAAVAGIVTFILGLIGAITPFVTDASWLKYLAIGVAVLSFIGTTVGVYVTSNTPPAGPPELPSDG
jgi:hypothetical protein